jgi:DNA-binding transcriptional MerR regulator
MSDRPRPRVGSSIRSVTVTLGLTHRAVRYYEERGMIRATRDSANCRVFDDVARRRLRLIALLRRSRLSLPDIHEVLEAGDELEQTEHALRKLALQKDHVLALLRAIETCMDQLGEGRAQPGVAIAAE